MLGAKNNNKPRYEKNSLIVTISLASAEYAMLYKTPLEDWVAFFLD